MRDHEPEFDYEERGAYIFRNDEIDSVIDVNALHYYSEFAFYNADGLKHLLRKQGKTCDRIVECHGSKRDLERLLKKAFARRAKAA